jgi:hypothetical protein
VPWYLISYEGLTKKRISFVLIRRFPKTMEGSMDLPMTNEMSIGFLGRKI